MNLSPEKIQAIDFEPNFEKVDHQSENMRMSIYSVRSKLSEIDNLMEKEETQNAISEEDNKLKLECYCTSAKYLEKYGKL